MNVEKQNGVNTTVFVCLRETRGIFFVKTVVCMNVEKQNGVNPAVLFYLKQVRYLIIYNNLGIQHNSHSFLAKEYDVYYLNLSTPSTD